MRMLQNVVVMSRNACMLSFALCAAAMAAGSVPAFQAAKPVWPAGRECEMNTRRPLFGNRVLKTQPSISPRRPFPKWDV